MIGSKDRRLQLQRLAELSQEQAREDELVEQFEAGFRSVLVDRWVGGWGRAFGRRRAPSRVGEGSESLNEVVAAEIS